jgi:hypothetical protein
MSRPASASGSDIYPDSHLAFSSGHNQRGRKAEDEVSEGVAAEQANALAATEGAIGPERLCGMVVVAFAIRFSVLVARTERRAQEKTLTILFFFL